MTPDPFKRKLVVPVPNLNGNKKGDLIARAVCICRALDEAMDALKEGADLVHGRNFQTCREPSVKLHAALEAMHERRAVLDHMRDEFMSLAIAIQNDEGAR